MYKIITSNERLAALTLEVRNAAQQGDGNACRLLKQKKLPYVSPATGITPDNLKDHIISLWDLVITPDDFHAVLSLTESLYRHATHILSFLPTTEVTSRENADRDALVQCMAERFTRAEFLQKAGEMGIKTDTASTWLKRLQKHGLVASVDGNGTYRKPLT